jgi:hypothetical protein
VRVRTVSVSNMYPDRRDGGRLRRGGPRLRSTCGGAPALPQSIAVWLVIVLSSVSPMSLLQPSLVASSGIPLHRGKWQHLPMFCLSVCSSVRVLPVACAPSLFASSPTFVCPTSVYTLCLFIYSLLRDPRTSCGSPTD